MARPRKEEPLYYIAKEGGYAVIGDEHCSFQAGVTTVERGHPLLDSCPDSFEPFVPTYPVKPREHQPASAS